jgi:hypothetical protein
MNIEEELRGEIGKLQNRIEELEKRTRWRTLITSYRTKDLRILKFPSESEINRAIDVCFRDTDFDGMPFDFADGLTMVVPEEAVALFRARGFQFKISRLLSPSDLTPEEYSELKRRRHTM